MSQVKMKYLLRVLNWLLISIVITIYSQYKTEHANFLVVKTFNIFIENGLRVLVLYVFYLLCNLVLKRIDILLLKALVFAMLTYIISIGFAFTTWIDPKTVWIEWLPIAFIAFILPLSEKMLEKLVHPIKI